MSVGLNCDVQKVRRDLHAEFGETSGQDRRRIVTEDSYLDVDSHGQASLRSILSQNVSSDLMPFDPADYCLVALDGSRPGQGVSLGNKKKATRRLVVVNWGDVHFDPCLPC